LWVFLWGLEVDAVEEDGEEAELVFLTDAVFGVAVFVGGVGEFQDVLRAEDVHEVDAEFVGSGGPVPGQVGLEVQAEVVLELEGVPVGVFVNDFAELVGGGHIDRAVPPAADHGALGAGDQREPTFVEAPFAAAEGVERVTAVVVGIAPQFVGALELRVKDGACEQDKPAVAEGPRNGGFYAVVAGGPGVDEGTGEEAVEAAAGIGQRVAAVGLAPRCRGVGNGNVEEVLVVGFHFQRPVGRERTCPTDDVVPAAGKAHVLVGHEQLAGAVGIDADAAGVEVR